MCHQYFFPNSTSSQEVMSCFREVECWLFACRSERPGFDYISLFALIDKFEVWLILSI